MALSAAPASAFFKASSGKYPVTISVSKNEPQIFKIGVNLVLSCTTLAAEGLLLGEGSQLTVAPRYSGCTAKLGGVETGGVVLGTNGCFYNYHQAKGATTGTLSIECPSGHSIELKLGLGCLIKIPKTNNTNLGGIGFVNEGSGTTEEIKVEPKLKGIHYLAKGCSGFVTEEPAEGTNMEEEGVLLLRGTTSGAQTGILVV
jgi:hypothetical protein